MIQTFAGLLSETRVRKAVVPLVVGLASLCAATYLLQAAEDVDQSTNSLQADADMVVQISFDHELGRSRFEELSNRRLESWKKSADEEEPIAIFLLGMNELMNSNGPRPHEAVKLLEKADKAGCAYAAAALGVIYESVLPNAGSALSYLNKAAENGSAWASYKLGVFYSEGERVKRDEERAFTLIETAAKGGLLAAQTDLACRYRSGLGCEMDSDLEEEWLKRAAEGGDGIGQCNYGALLFSQGKHEDAVTWWKKAAENGNVRAHYNLGVAYENGEGVNRNLNDAIDHYAQSARNGDTKGLTASGLFLIKGQHPVMGRNITLGLGILSQAAQKGDTEATWLLAEMLVEAKRVNFDSEQFTYKDKWSMPQDAQYQELEYQRREDKAMETGLP